MRAALVAAFGVLLGCGHDLDLRVTPDAGVPPSPAAPLAPALPFTASPVDTGFTGDALLTACARDVCMLVISGSRGPVALRYLRATGARLDGEPLPLAFVPTRAAGRGDAFCIADGSEVEAIPARGPPVAVDVSTVPPAVQPILGVGVEEGRCIVLSGDYSDGPPGAQPLQRLRAIEVGPGAAEAPLWESGTLPDGRTGVGRVSLVQTADGYEAMWIVPVSGDVYRLGLNDAGGIGRQVLHLDNPTVSFVDGALVEWLEGDGQHIRIQSLDPGGASASYEVPPTHTTEPSSPFEGGAYVWWAADNGSMRIVRFPVDDPAIAVLAAPVEGSVTALMPLGSTLLLVFYVSEGNVVEQRVEYR